MRPRPHHRQRPADRGTVTGRSVAGLALLALGAGALALPATLACRTVGNPPPEELDLWEDAAAGVQDRSLARLCANVWEAHLKAYPLEATRLGDPRYHGEVPLSDPNWKEVRGAELERFQRRMKHVDPDTLSEGDRLAWVLLEEELEKAQKGLELGLEEFTVNPLYGPHLQLLGLAGDQPCESAREREQLVERCRGWSGVMRQQIRNLRRGMSEGRVSSRRPVLKTISQLEEILDTHPMDSPLVALATGGGEWVELEPRGSVAAIAHDVLGDARRQRELRKVNLHLQDGERLVIGTRVLIPAADDPLSPEERGEFLYGVLTAVEEAVRPSFATYRDFLQNELLGRTRPDSRPGLRHLPGGVDIYRELVRAHTSLPYEECDPQAIHDYGLEEVARIRGEIASLGSRVFGTDDVAEIQERLRTDPELHFATRDEVQAKAAEALYRAQAKMGRYFGILPEAPCEVVRVPAFEEKDTTIAYYREPAADGSVPGRYFINTFRPETRPRYEAEVLAYHEAIPGHHLQIAIAQELEDLPRFRRHMGSTAFVEGWALYTERLSDEMGLYSSDTDRFGILSFDAWRACRLVVDTGIHAFGWSREEAIEYLYENTLLARNNVENEVDRYIARPGQALAYKIGQREILALRAAARAELGSAFSYPEFHDRVLENGAVSLSVLREVIGRWLGVSGSGSEG